MAKLVVQTELNTDKFDRQIEDLQRKADKKEVEIKVTTEKINSLEEEIKHAKEERDAYFKEYEKLLAEQGRFQELARRNTSGLKADALTYAEQKEYGEGIFRDFDYEIEELDKKIQEATVGNFEKLSETLEKQKTKLQDQQYEYQKISNKIDEIRQKQERIKIETTQDNLKNIGKSITSITKKVARWGLAIFGIRSAYMAVRNAMNIISENDEQLRADIDYIKTALAYTLEPVVRRIVELTRQLLIYLGYIIKQWTGKNIFENVNKSLKKSASSAKELKKQLAGFDEMNVLNDTNSSSSNTTPSFNLYSEIENLKPPQWLSKITGWLDEIIALIGGVSAALIFLRLFGISPIKALGIGVMITGITYAIEGLLKYLEDPSWENFGQIIQGIGLAVLGLGIIIGGVPAIVAGAIILIVGTIIKHWEEIKKFFEEKVFKWMDKQIEKLEKTTFGRFFSEIFRESKGTIKEILNVFDGLFKGLKDILNGTIRFYKGDFSGGLKLITKGLVNSLISYLNAFIAAFNLLILPVRGLIVAFGKVSGKNWNMENVRIPQIPYLARGGIVNMPSRGVPVGSAIAGERGQEGVIPLTDSQQMALLGEAIGKYITINANITNTMNGRVISREIQKVQNNSNFAMNK